MDNLDELEDKEFISLDLLETDEEDEYEYSNSLALGDPTEEEPLEVSSDYSEEAEVILTSPKTKKGTKKAKVIIPEGSHPLIAFMISREFTIAEIESLTKIPKDVLLGIIKGDEVKPQERSRIRLVTGVRV